MTTFLLTRLHVTMVGEGLLHAKREKGCMWFSYDLQGACSLKCKAKDCYNEIITMGKVKNRTRSDLHIFD